MSVVAIQLIIPHLNQKPEKELLIDCFKAHTKKKSKDSIVSSELPWKKVPLKMFNVFAETMYGMNGKSFCDLRKKD